MNKLSKIMHTKIRASESFKNSRKATISKAYKSAAKWLRKNRHWYESA